MGVSNALRTNQINVYLDANTNGTIPTHTTIDGTENLGGSNLIDMCVYSQSWIERSVRITISTAGYYWLSFAADGQNDSYGGQLDNIRLCNGTCAGSVEDNFPSAWISSPTLFEDTFESPTYTNGSSYNTNGNMGKSLGTSGASSGWPGQTASGWANAPTNQLPYWLQGCPQGSQCIELGWASGSGPNSLISRPFLLDPGYYKVTYDYVSEVTFSGLSGAYCGANPSSANIPTLSIPDRDWNQPRSRRQSRNSYRRHKHRGRIHVACPARQHPQPQHYAWSNSHLHKSGWNRHHNPDGTPQQRQLDRLQFIAKQSTARHLWLCGLVTTAHGICPYPEAGLLLADTCRPGQRRFIRRPDR